jgi:hypothetical protein
MIDRAERQFGSFTIKKRLQLIPIDGAETPLLELSQQVVVDSIFRRHSCRALPFPFVKGKENALHKITESSIWVGLGASVNGTKDLSELFFRLGLCHFRRPSELLSAPFAILPPPSDPRPVKLHHITFLKPFPHLQLLVGAAYGIRLWLVRENTFFVMLFPILERRPTDNLFPAERDAGKLGNVSNVAIQQSVHLRFGTT